MTGSRSAGNRKVHVISLGCPKNLVDAERMLSSLICSGYEITQEKATAETIIVNTCSFLRSAKEESLETLLEVSRLKEHGALRKLVATGCLVQLYGNELSREVPEVDVFIGAEDEARIGEILGNSPAGPHPPGDRTLLTAPGSAYLKISDGCSNRCSYCLIPAIKGPFRSRPQSLLLDESRRLVEVGVKELILVSQDTTAYGQDLGPGCSLESLLRELVKIEGLHWIRLLYCNPSHFTDGLVSLIRDEEKICKYLDIPVQHINDRVLRNMNRRTLGRDIRSLIQKLRLEVPRLTLRSTAIVGFPGETRDEFLELLSFLKEAEMEWFGAFPYSREQGTPASAHSGQVPRKLREERWEEFMGIQSSISQGKNESLIGLETDVLIEGCEDGRVYGRTSGQAPEVDGRTYVDVPEGMTAPRPGEILRVRVIDGLTYDLVAEPFQASAPCPVQAGPLSRVSTARNL